MTLSHHTRRKHLILWGDALKYTSHLVQFYQVPLTVYSNISVKARKAALPDIPTQLAHMPMLRDFERLLTALEDLTHGLGRHSKAYLSK